MQAAAKRRMTAREYLEVERKAETKSEFLDGEKFAMAGGASLAEYILVSQDGWLIEHYTRQSDGGWRLATVDGAKGALTFKSVKVRVLLTETYANTGLKPGILPPDPIVATPHKK